MARRRGSNDPDSKVSAELTQNCADSTVGSMHQDRLPRFASASRNNICHAVTPFTSTVSACTAVTPSGTATRFRAGTTT